MPLAQERTTKVNIQFEIPKPEMSEATSFVVDGRLLWGNDALHEVLCVLAHEQDQGHDGKMIDRFNKALHWLRDNVTDIVHPNEYQGGA